MDRWEYVVAGPPMQEISIAEPLASSGETVVSPTVVSALGGEVSGGKAYAQPINQIVIVAAVVTRRQYWLVACALYVSIRIVAFVSYHLS